VLGSAISIEELPATLLNEEPGQKAAMVDDGVVRRPCFSCGIILTEDEWVLVAGPRILCRACFHEEFKAGKHQSAQSDQSVTTDSDSLGAQVSGASDAPDPNKASGTAPPAEAETTHSPKGLGLAVFGGALLLGGIAVTILWGFTWGFTPLAGGVILGLIGGLQHADKR